MPYVKQEARYALDHGGLPTTPGELNYVITKIAIKRRNFLIDMRREIRDAVLSYIGDKASYTLFNEVMGVLECARFEYLRRVGWDPFINATFVELKDWLYGGMIAPYEDKKIQENGDVY